MCLSVLRPFFAQSVWTLPQQFFTNKTASMKNNSTTVTSTQINKAEAIVAYPNPFIKFYNFVFADKEDRIHAQLFDLNEGLFVKKILEIF